MRKLFINLSLFDGDGGAAAGTGAGESGSGENTNAVAAGQHAQANADKNGQSTGANAIPDAGNAENAEGESPNETKDESFGDLIKGKYKEDFDAAVQKIINSRFKQVKGLEKQNKELSDKLAQLRRNVGVASDEDLLKAIGEDNELFNKQAYEHNMEPEAYRKFRDMQEGEAQAKAEVERYRQQEAVNEKVRKYSAMEKELKTVYPDFDFRAELADETTGDAFYTMLEMGIGMKEAYHALHPDRADRATENALKYARAQGAKEATDNVKARAARPSENGSGANGGGMKYDILKMTPAECEELEARAFRGEKVYL